MHDLAIASHRVEMSSPLCMRPLLIINSTQKSDLIGKQVIIKYYKLIKVVILIFINSKYMFFKVIIEIYTRARVSSLVVFNFQIIFSLLTAG